MKNLKRSLALMLVLSMMLTAVPFGAFATESDVDAVADDGTAVTTLTLGTKPDNGSTEGNPFIKGTAKSESFRIPAMVTLSDGTLVAAADARWNTTFDGGGLDTIVARSFDKGATWNYTFANYLGDNGNAYNHNSTCFIDPSLAVKTVDGVETIYMLCDLYPYGVALNGNGQQTAPKYDTGFTGDGKLLLSNDNHANYNYYLDGNEIKDSSGKTVSGLTVNAHFDVTGTYNGITYNTNLFFSDSPFKVARTGYLYLTKSTDKGESWSEPTLLPLKTGKEMVCLVGPGRGLVTKDGTIVFPVYSYSGESAKYTALIYSDDGVNWTRTENFADEISSEAALVELDTGAIRVFFRNENSELTYTDYIQGAGFGNAVTTGVKVNSDTQLSAISYSKTVDGNQVILVSAPAGPNAAGSNNNNGAYRSSGKVFCGIVNKNVAVRSMTWQRGSVAVTPVATGAFSDSTYTAQQGFFAYSCLTELKDNSVAILYEDSQQGWGTGCSYTMDYKTYTESALEAAFGVTFDEDENVGILSDAQNHVEVNLGSTDTTGWNMTVESGQKVADLVGEYVAYDVTITKADGNAYTDSAEVTLPLGELAGKSDVYPFIITDGKVEKLTATKVDDSYITFTAPHFSVMGVAARAVAITDTVDVTLKVGETSKTYTDTTGNYENDPENVAPNSDIAEMTVTATEGSGGTVTPLTSLTAGEANTFYIQVSEGTYLTDTCGTTNNINEAALWYAYYAGPTYCTIRNVNTAYYLSVGYDGVVTTNQYTSYMKMSNGQLVGYYSNYAAGTPVTVSGSTPSSTEITFTGKAAGTTVAYVGNTQYNITVTTAGVDKVVNVNLEVGETVTYVDTSGNYVGSDTIVEPDKTIASMSVANGMALKAVTALESGKKYLIVNKANGTILTDTEMNVSGNYGNKPGLATTGTASADSKELWTITSVNGGYTVVQNEKYLAVAGFEAHMKETPVPLTLSHTDDGWLIYDYTTGPAMGHDAAGYYLSDNIGSNYVNGALGTSDTSNTYRYWEIYEIQPLNTEITFTGNAVGKTTATVGSTAYHITVEQYVLDDEINDSDAGFTVNAELQYTRYRNLINGVAKDLYTDESWPAYESARKAAYAKLNEVNGTTYATKAEAETAVAELVAAMDALEAAKAKLVAAKTITVHYQLSKSTVLTEEYKVIAGSTTLTLPDVLVVDKQTYTVSATQTEGVTITDGVLTLPENDTVVYIAVDKGVALGDGFVASADISADGDYVGTGAQIADLVKDDGTAMKITEMTLTTGFSYDLNLASDTTGYTVEWSSDNEGCVTVDQNGKVTAVAAGTANVIATVKDANGNVIEVNSIPVTVFTSASTDRTSAVYIEHIENTTVYCVVNADTDAKTFKVIEGELIYGKFDTTVKDGSATTGFSFFGDPDEAHALVAMTSTNSFGDYYLLHDDDGNLAVGPEYYVLGDGYTGAGYWQAIGLTDNVHDQKADWTLIKNMVQWAIDQGCDGGMGFTRRQSEGNIGSNLTFISDPMPKIEKQVDGVLSTTRKMDDYRRYTEGMVAAVHELVYFKITVTLERPTTFTDAAKTISAITYDEAFVNDTILKGAYLYTKELDRADGVYDGEIDEAHRTQTQEITNELNAAWAVDETERTIELYLLYEIQESDIPKFYIDNIAYLNYDYESHYSTGAQAGAADAEARISVVGTAIDNVVIDFGQSFTYQGHTFTSITDGKQYTFDGLTNTHLKGAFVDGTYDEKGNYVAGANDLAGITDSKVVCKYGTAKVTRRNTGEVDDKGYPKYTYTVTYTPTQILQEPDTVLIYGIGDENKEKIINGFVVYPATTVYYEEGFMLSDGQTWDATNAQKATAEQTFELLGASQFNDHGELTHKVSNKKHAYGYDPIYDPNNDDGKPDAAKSYISATDVGKSTTFTFTGKGFDLFADCTTSTGSVSVQVKNSAGKYVKIFTVNTIVGEGYTGVTGGQNTDMDSLPIVSWHTDTHDTYTVTVRKILNNGKEVKIDGVRIFDTVEDSTVFTVDREDNPEFYQLRDHVLYALQVEADDSIDYKTMHKQVYELLGEGQSAVILSTNDPYENANTIGSTVYTRTTTKTTVNTTTYTDGTSAVVTRVDTTLEEYTDPNREELSRVRTTTTSTSVYKDANGVEITQENFGDATYKVIASESVTDPVEKTVEGEMTVATAQDLLDNGPKNEIYLHEGESLVFKVKTKRMMQIGLKAPIDATNYSVKYTVNNSTTTVADKKTVNTTVDMFYELGNTALENAADYTITITNNGSNILAVTDLKICDDPSAAFADLTEKDIETALTDMGYGDPCAKGHSYDAVVTAPTCTEAGYTTYTCAVCGDSYVGDETEALGHSHEAVVTDPTCTEAGYTTYTCTVCGDSYVGDETEALGHSYDAVVTEPTCTEQGYTTYTCHCGDTYVDDYVDATGHNYSNGSCTDCGAKDPNDSGSSSNIGQTIAQIIGWLIGLIKR